MGLIMEGKKIHEKLWGVTWNSLSIDFRHVNIIFMVIACEIFVVYLSRITRLHRRSTIYYVLVFTCKDICIHG